jgi:integrase
MHNICKDVDPPRAEASEIRPFDQKEARGFLIRAEGERYHALYCLALTSGMRRGEILGLRWESLDLTQRTLQIRHALVAGRGSPSFGSPKTTKSRRNTTLTAKAVEALIRHRKRQREAGFSVENDALVFTSTKDTPVNTSRLRLAFKVFLKRTELLNIRFQDLRHTYATLLPSKGIHPKIVSEQLGHANIGITLDTYSRVLPGMGDAAAGAMDEALE